MTFHDNNNVPPLKDGREWNLPILSNDTKLFLYKKKKSTKDDGFVEMNSRSKEI